MRRGLSRLHKAAGQTLLTADGSPSPSSLPLSSSSNWLAMFNVAPIANFRAVSDLYDNFGK
jgi:hypothetical protein